MSAFGGKAALQLARLRLLYSNARFSPKRTLGLAENHEIKGPLSAISSHSMPPLDHFRGVLFIDEIPGENWKYGLSRIMLWVTG